VPQNTIATPYPFVNHARHRKKATEQGAKGRRDEETRRGMRENNKGRDGVSREVKE